MKNNYLLIINLFLLFNFSFTLKTLGPFPKHENYEMIKVLGSGSFGNAIQVYNRDDDKLYVIKVINLKGIEKEKINKIQEEAKLLSKFNNEYIVKYYESFIEGDTFNIVMEYCEGDNLRKFINDYKYSNNLIDKRYIINFIYCISSALQEIHNKKFIHRDIKPENLFLTKDFTIKVGDFGIAKELNDKNFTNTLAGTPLYMAPEIIYGYPYNNKVDIWSFGCIIYELCTKKAKSLS